MSQNALLQKCLFPFLVEEEEHFPILSCCSEQSDIDVYEDEHSMVISAPVPGLQAEEIDITFQKGVLTIQGNKKEEEEDKKRKYYRRSSKTFAYQVAVPGNIDETQEPKAELKAGVMRVSFEKKKKEEPKRIQIRCN